MFPKCVRGCVGVYEQLETFILAHVGNITTTLQNGLFTTDYQCMSYHISAPSSSPDALRRDIECVNTSNDVV